MKAVNQIYVFSAILKTRKQHFIPIVHSPNAQLMILKECRIFTGTDITFDFVPIERKFGFYTSSSILTLTSLSLFLE